MGLIMNKKIVLFCGLLASFQPVFADQYFSELTLGYSDGEIYSVDTEIWSGTLTGYFNLIESEPGVSLDSGPYSEAGFSSRASSLSYTYSDAEFDNLGSAEVYDTELRLVVGLGGIFEVRVDGGDTVADTYSAALGAYWGENSATVVRLGFVEADFNSETGVDADAYSVEIDTHGVIETDSLTFAYDVTFGWAVVDTLNENGKPEDDFSPVLGGGLTYYPNRQTGIGVQANWNDLAGVDTFTYSLYSEYFILPRIGIAAGYTKQEQSNGIGTSVESWTVALTGRL